LITSADRDEETLMELRHKGTMRHRHKGQESPSAMLFYFGKAK
jgi:hypothetical protein